MEIGRSLNRLEVIHLSDSGAELAQIRNSAASVDIKLATCSEQDDTEKLLSALEAGFGGATGFNDWLHDALPRMMPSCCNPVSATDPTYVRGVQMPDLLLHTGLLSGWNLWRVGVDGISHRQKQRLYSLSRPTAGKLGVFLSHSWATSGLYKALHLHSQGCALESALVLLLVQALIFSGSCLEVLPNFNKTWTVRMYFGDTAVDVASVPYCLFLSPFIWLFAMVFVPLVKTLLPKGQMLFLDAVCINQADPEMKRKGIANFEAVLQEAGQLHVPWSPEYLKRRWCVFELAGYMGQKGMKSIVFYHVLEAPLLLIIMAVSWLVAVATWISWTGISSIVPAKAQDAFGYTSAATCCLILLVPFHITRKWIHSGGALLNELSSFDMTSAVCRNASDNDYIQDRIIAWHGSVDGFCKHVREHLYPQLQMSGAVSLRPSYAKSLFVSSVVFGLQLDIAAGLILQTDFRHDLLAQYILQCACLDFAVYPLVLWILFMLARMPMKNDESSRSRLFDQATSFLCFLAFLAGYQSLELSLTFAKHAGMECLACVALLISFLAWFVYLEPVKCC
eukprot:TRINITY_DN103921_c0_g1_i1.p1 TRINITY_DN103921_c0_g1~~TRINITY_DN103921_c0_g1_i1.p1  ORF type:complete len:616 (+),score=66.96 TRINITY_DN103921_c0_g1_i1:157-1848(+)